MPFDFKLTAEAFLRRLFSARLWLQASACAIVAWSLLHGGISIVPSGSPAGPTASPAAAVAPDVAPATAGIPGSEAPSTAVSPLQANPAASGLQLASAAPLDEARLALSTIDVIVTLSLIHI